MKNLIALTLYIYQAFLYIPFNSHKYTELPKTIQLKTGVRKRKPRMVVWAMESSQREA